jgi:hypothetical protein
MTTYYIGTNEFARGEDLRLQADSCRQLASIARTERNKLFWLRLADEWAKLAVAADEHEARERCAP